MPRRSHESACDNDNQQCDDNNGRYRRVRLHRASPRMPNEIELTCGPLRPAHPACDTSVLSYGLRGEWNPKRFGNRFNIASNSKNRAFPPYALRTFHICGDVVN